MSEQFAKSLCVFHIWQLFAQQQIITIYQLFAGLQIITIWQLFAETNDHEPVLPSPPSAVAGLLQRGRQRHRLDAGQKNPVVTRTYETALML